MTRIITPALALLALLASAPGCATPTPRETIERSGGVLAPLAFAGQALEAAGSFVWEAATPFGSGYSEFDRLPEKERFDDGPTGEQVAALEEHSVAWDLAEDIELIGLGAGSGQFAPPVRSVLVSVEQTVGARFDWYLNPNLNDAAMAFPGGVIVINPRAARQLSSDALFLLLFHEAGHHMLGHTRGAATVRGGSQPWLKPPLELAADCFAAGTMRNAGYSPQRIAYAALQFYGDRARTRTHPAGRERVNKARECSR